MERKEARRLGLSTYDTGRPCRRGHLSPRYVIGGQCIECIATPERVVRLLFPSAADVGPFEVDLALGWRAARTQARRRLFKVTALEGGAAEVEAYVPPSQMWGLVGSRAKAGTVLPLSAMPWSS